MGANIVWQWGQTQVTMMYPKKGRQSHGSLLHMPTSMRLVSKKKASYSDGRDDCFDVADLLRDEHKEHGSERKVAKPVRYRHKTESLAHLSLQTKNTKNARCRMHVGISRNLSWAAAA